MCINFGKIKIFFMVLKAQVRTYELRGQEIKKEDFSNTLDIEVTGPEVWHQFRKNQNFSFNGPKGTGLDL